MLLRSLIVCTVFETALSGTNWDIRQIFAVGTSINSSNCSVSIVPPTNRPINKVKRTRSSNAFHPHCQPWDSCRNRCENHTAIPPYSCSCDPLCTFYGDCCIDYELACRIRSHQVGHHSTKFGCLYDNMDLPTYAIMSCPPDYSNDSRIRSDCENDILPVTSESGIVYSNPSCAFCNQDNGTLSSWAKANNMFQPTKDSPEVRMCLPVIDWCSVNDPKRRELETFCHKFSGPVLGFNTERYYKNIYCALCNGEVMEQLSCPVWSFSGFNSLSSLRQSITNVFSYSGKKSKVLFGKLDYDSIPASFSILLNFGLDGKERMMFSSEGEEEMRENQKRCGEAKIWDPFSNVCRALYCSAEFILIDFQCIPKTGTSDELTTSGDKPSLDNEQQCVHLTLDVEVSAFGVFEYNITSYSQFSDYLKEGLASFFNITRDRIKDLRLRYSGDQTTAGNDTSSESSNEELWNYVVKLEASFTLCEELNVTTKSEPTVDNIMTMITTYITLNSFVFEVANISSKVFEFRKSVDSASGAWCGNNSVQKQYWNQEFTLILTNSSADDTNWIKAVYINKTGRIYRKGEFVVNILFQGNRNSEDLVNVSGVVFVCERKPNMSCPYILLSSGEYNISTNGTLIYAANPETVLEFNDSEYQLTHNNSVMLCYNADRYKGRYANSSGEYNLRFDSTQAIISLFLSCISIVALALVLVTYLLFSSLRTLPGCNVMNLTGSTFAMQITFLLGQRHSVQGVACKLVGLLVHFEIMASFFWMNVMAYDLYRTFGAKDMIIRVREKRLLLRYAIYAYGAPCFVVVLAYCLDSWYPDLGPQYGLGNNCWITNRKAALLFFAFPLAVILSANTVLYIMTVRAISSLHKTIQSKSEKSQRNNDGVLYMRMATVMGFTWALAFFAAWYPQKKLVGHMLTYLFIIFNTLQGLFIFFGFVCNRRVLKLYLDLLHNMKILKLKQCRKCQKRTCKCQSKISRTTSTESTFSIISDSVPTLVAYNSIAEK